jgi:hypothetical protein
LRDTANEKWFASIRLEGVAEGRDEIIVRTWRKSSGGTKVIETVIMLREDESITFTDGESEE